MDAATGEARYDGIADWYAQWTAGQADRWRDTLVTLLGAGPGPCLDLGCGTGEYVDVLRSTGRRVVGLDVSADQLRFAKERADAVVLADGSRLPFAAGSFEAVAAIWVSTDVDDLGAVLSDSARVLRPGGVFVFLGVHPCFNGPGVENRPDGSRLVHPNYRSTGWQAASPWWEPDGVRVRVGMRHVPLAGLLNAVVDVGLRPERFVEPGGDEVPFVLALRATKA
ncbi:MAG: class I SAM-dependent methyltransferase [Streptosporangiales bacterium]|nr:class I SAM-dependent methyltransferase [Streptosporangiales bacterium]